MTITTGSGREIALPAELLDDDDCTTLWEAWRDAANNYADAAAAHVATMARTLWPDAETLLVTAEESVVFGEYHAKLVLVRDAVGGLLWFNPDAMGTPADADAWMAQHGEPADLDDDTGEAFGEHLTKLFDVMPEYLPESGEKIKYLPDLREMSVQVALRGGE